MNYHALHEAIDSANRLISFEYAFCINSTISIADFQLARLRIQRAYDVRLINEQEAIYLNCYNDGNENLYKKLYDIK